MIRIRVKMTLVSVLLTCKHNGWRRSPGERGGQNPPRCIPRSKMDLNFQKQPSKMTPMMISFGEDVRLPFPDSILLFPGLWYCQSPEDRAHLKKSLKEKANIWCQNTQITRPKCVNSGCWRGSNWAPINKGVLVGPLGGLRCPGEGGLNWRKGTRMRFDFRSNNRW